MKNKKKILIFIPSLNVENEIASVFKRIPKKIFRKNIFLLAIDDNSNDNTYKKLLKIKKYYKIKIFRNKRNLGYGGVQKMAYDYAVKKNMDYAIMLHGDGQYDPKKLPEFISKLLLDKYDAIFGSRMHSYFSAISGGMPLYKFFGNIFLTKIQNFILGSKLSEFHSGYRAYTVNSLKK